MGKVRENKTLAENKKARHDYFIEESLECGIELVGTEVKSMRTGRANLKDSYAEIRNGEIFACNIHVGPYKDGSINNRDPLRRRKLLLHKNEIRRFESYISRQGYTLIPLSLYLKNGRVKVQLSVGKGKKEYDKRDVMLEKAAKRDIARQFKELNKY